MHEIRYKSLMAFCPLHCFHPRGNPTTSSRVAINSFDSTLLLQVVRRGGLEALLRGILSVYHPQNAPEIRNSLSGNNPALDRVLLQLAELNITAMEMSVEVRFRVAITHYRTGPTPTCGITGPPFFHLVWEPFCRTERLFPPFCTAPDHLRVWVDRHPVWVQHLNLCSDQ